MARRVARRFVVPHFPNHRRLFRRLSRVITHTHYEILTLFVRKTPKFCLLIDDLNMPMREKYFAQPPIELLRQWFDHNGWYDRTPPCAFKQIVDVILVACMGPPGGGRNPVSNRTLRHFNFLSFTDMSDASLVVIFDSILGATLGKKFTQDVASLSTKFVEATVEVYNVVRRDLLPTPAKSHYTFNLRDLARVFQGLLRAVP